MGGSAVVYARLSRSEPQSASIATQVADGVRYAEGLGLRVVAVLVDEDVSGGKPLGKRPAGASLVRLVRAEEAGHVIARDQTRIGRHTADAVALRDEWAGRGVSLHYTAEGGAQDLASATGQFVYDVKSAAAALYRNKIREDTRRALAAKRAEGVRVGRPPRGFRVVAGRMERDPGSDGVTLARRAHELRASGLSLRAIAERLGAAHSTVAYMLRNPAYAEACDG